MRILEKAKKNKKKQVFSRNSSFPQGVNIILCIVMTMLHSFHENFELYETETQFEVFPSHKHTQAKKGKVHLFTDKLRVPKFGAQIKRPRLTQMLAKSSKQFGSTLVFGRAGTGKTAIAVEFAKQYEDVAWYSIESADSNWEVFSKYFAASFNEPYLIEEELNKNESEPISSAEIAYFVESLFARLALIDSNEPRLIVIDNAHYIFDSEWFTSFFQTLICSLLPNTHLLLLSRCEPNLPLWRLRSKQVLGVLDEKLLSFTFEEAKNLFEDCTLSQEFIETSYSRSFGRISKLKEIAESFDDKEKISRKY